MIHRRSREIKGVCIVLIVVALFVIIRVLPVDQAMDLLKSKVDGLGFWGPFAYGAVYVVAALAFIPGSALTLSAGAVFGLTWGTVTASLASTTAATMAFLIARYLARDKVARQANRYLKFKAIDGAIGSGGWKIIAMLRLSPAIPFSLGNYLYGLTAIRLWPYVWASWLFMLPGTFLFVYLGHIGSEGLQSTAGVERVKTPAEWALLSVGFLATIVVTTYVASLSRKAFRERTHTNQQTTESAQTSESPERNTAVAMGWPWGTTVLAAVAVAMLAVAAYAQQNRNALKYLFGPPSVVLHKAYQRQSNGPTFDHATFDALLRKHVDKDGWVDYEELRSDAKLLDAYIASLAEAHLAKFGRDEKLAFLINAYNAFTLRLVLDHCSAVMNRPRHD